MSSSREERIAYLKKNRQRDWFLRISLGVVGICVAWAWLTSRPLLGKLSAERRWRNFQNFVGDLVPSPIRKGEGWTEFFPWASELFFDDGFPALVVTVAIATAAIIISSAVVLPSLAAASRRLSQKNALDIPGGNASPVVSVLWKVVGPVVRFGYVLARAVPEYLVAFLLISLLGPQVWPLVLALAIHNFGILGRLWGEVVENADTTAAAQRIATGNSRFNTFMTTLFPASFNRFVIYFFYRWETCVKDATVLGMLGLLTLGKLIALSKGFYWDRMFFYVMLSASVIMIGDLLSTFVRARLRE